MNFVLASCMLQINTADTASDGAHTLKRCIRWRCIKTVRPKPHRTIHTSATMKAVCVLVCLALARHCAGSIFHRRAPARMDRLAVQPPVAEYLDPYLQEKYLAQYPYVQQVYRQNENLPIYEERNVRQPPRRMMTDNMLVNQDITMDDKMLQRVFRTDKVTTERQNIARNSDSSTVETNSQETIGTLNSLTGFDQQFAAPRFADMGVVSRSALLNEKPALYGDAAVWRSLKIATSPEWPVEKKDIEKIFGDAMMATKHIQPETKTELHNAVETALQIDSEDLRLNATELLKKYQYPVEEHTIKTDDGYFLTLFRISAKQIDLAQPRPVVFLMHGLLGSADDWLLMGPGKSLAYLLADAGYDVWLGNARGSRYTRHVSKSRAQPDFWQFSIDEIALHDLPAMIDYVLETAKVQKMFYVGHSTGTSAFFALASARPEYNDKIVMMYALSPMVYMSYVRSPLVRMLAPNSRLSSRLHEQLGQGEFRPDEELLRTVGGAMCENEIGCKNVCSNAYFVTSGVNVENLEPSQIPSIMSHLPAGGSTKQMKQYGQAVTAHDFRMFDFGPEMNEKVYGKPQPPSYMMDKVTTPVVLYHSEHDWLAHPKDVARLQKELPNAMIKRIPEDYFSHNDFIVSKKAPELVYKHLIESIQKPQLKTQEQQQTSY